jgi:hypothetical protein
MKKSLVVVALAGALAILWCSSLFAQWGTDVRLSSFVADKCFSNAWNLACNGQVVYAVWSAPGPIHPYGSLYYSKSIDGGATWTVQEQNIPQAGSTTYRPAMAVSGSVVYVVWLDDRNTYNHDIYFTRSLNGGGNWETATQIRVNGNYKVNPSIAAIGTDVHIVWDEQNPTNSNQEVWYKGSLNYGLNWGADTRLSPNPPDNYYHQFPTVAAVGTYVYAAWEDNRDGQVEIYYNIDANRGQSWVPGGQPLTAPPAAAMSPVIAAEGQRVHLAYWKDPLPGDPPGQIYYRRSNDYGSTWQPDMPISTVGPPYAVFYPSLAVSWPRIHVAWVDNRDGPLWSSEIYYDRSLDGGLTWEPETRLTSIPPQYVFSYYPSLALSDSAVHLTFEDDREGTGYYHIYYMRNPIGNMTFPCMRTENSQGRHFVRDPYRNVVHLVMTKNTGANDTVYYTRSSDNGFTWVAPKALGVGQYPTVGLARIPLGMMPGDYYAVCVAYQTTAGTLKYLYNDNIFDPGSGTWHSFNLSTASNPGAPSLVAGGPNVYVAYSAGSSPQHLYCQHFTYDYTGVGTEEIDNGSSGAASQPCLTNNGEWWVYAVWQRGTEIWYSVRDPNIPGWTDYTRISRSGHFSQQPFIECYGESVFVVRSEDSQAASEIWRKRKHLDYSGWYDVQLTNNSVLDESPTQAGREFTTWPEDVGSGLCDIYKWSSTYNQTPNPIQTTTFWSYWPHSQMAYWFNWQGWIGADLWSAWTERTTQNSGPYLVFTNFTSFPAVPPPGAGGDGDAGPVVGSTGSYYQVYAGQDTPSAYCRKRDGVLRFSKKAVDFARDSLVYELRYLNPMYDYFVRVASYRETGSDWTEAISLDGKALRTVQFAPNKVDTAWFKIPLELYQDDHRVVVTARKVRGDYVTRLGMTLFQVDPKNRGKGGGPQLGEPVSLPVREVFAVFPNPMSSQTQIEYSLKAPGQVNLSVYDVTGRMVRKLVHGTQPAGVFKASWDGKDANGRSVVGGVYFLRLTSPEKTKTARLVVVR